MKQRKRLKKASFVKMVIWVNKDEQHLSLNQSKLGVIFVEEGYASDQLE